MSLARRARIAPVAGWGFIFLTAALLCFSGRAKVDLFTVMAEVENISRLDFWPDFHPGEIPYALGDGERTFLVHFPGRPKGFSPVEGQPDVQVYEGVHPAVFGNMRGRIDDVWIAVSIPQETVDASGRLSSPREMAAVVLHEKFHVFQATRHPDWQANDLVLMRYPPDTAGSICARAMEIEAFRRALACPIPAEAAGWSKAALAIRKTRLDSLEEEDADYDRRIQLQEGLAEYIQARAAGNGESLTASVSQFAPRAIREMGYFEGRYLAELLDRFDPDWKQGLEAEEFRFLDERLAEVLSDIPGEAAFSQDEKVNFWEASRMDIAERTRELAKIRRDFSTRPGTTIVIDFRARPFRFKLFDPFHIDLLSPGDVVHENWVLLENEYGTVEVLGQPCLTKLDPQCRIVRLVIPGISRRPSIGRNGRSIRFQQDGLGVLLRNAQYSYEGSSYLLIRVR